MKTTIKTYLNTALAIAITASVTTAAQANNYHGAYVGAKLAQSLTDEISSNDATADIDEPMSYGLYGGYTWPNHFGFELAYNQTEDADVEVSGTKTGEANINSLGAYVTYAHYPQRMGPLYIKGKLGVVRADAEFEPTAGDSTSEDDTGIGAGIGLGYDLTPNFSLEGEYNYAAVNEDLSDIGIGLKLKF